MELRWANKAWFVYDDDKITETRTERVLQYRVFHNTKTTSGVIGLEGGMWSEWKDIPEVSVNATAEKNRIIDK